MVNAKRIGHATFETADLERQTDYYTDLLGLTVAEREKDRVFLATKIGQLAIQLNKGERERCIKLSFEVAPNSDFGERRARTCERRHQERAAQRLPSRHRRGARVRGLQGHDRRAVQGLELSRQAHTGVGSRTAQARARGLGRERRPKATCDFYARVLGFRVSDWIGDFFVFIRCNADHHTLNFIRGKNEKMHHMAFELKDVVHLQSACDLLGQRKHPILWGPLRHGPGHNMAIHHRNPDDQVIELYCELDQMLDEELGYFVPRPWHHDTPQRPKVWPTG